MTRLVVALSLLPVLASGARCDEPLEGTALLAVKGDLSVAMRAGFGSFFCESSRTLSSGTGVTASATSPRVMRTSSPRRRTGSASRG